METDLYDSPIPNDDDATNVAFDDNDEPEDYESDLGDSLSDDEFAPTVLDDNGHPSTPEQKINRQEQLRMLHLRKYLNQLSEQVAQKDYNVQKTRNELKKCREKITELERERDSVFVQIESSLGSGNVSATNRLQAQHERVLVELVNEKDIEEDIKKTLDKAEYQLSYAQVEQSKFVLADEELKKKEVTLKHDRTEMAMQRNVKEQHYAKQAEKRSKLAEREKEYAIEEHERKHRQAIEDAKKSQQKANKYLKQTMDRVRQQEVEEEEKSRVHIQKRMTTLLSLKKNISDNKENLKAVQARDKHNSHVRQMDLDAQRAAVIAEGGNPDEVLLNRLTMEQLDKEKSLFGAKQKERQVDIAARILQEESRMKKRMKQQPQLWTDPKNDKTKRVSDHKKKRLNIFKESESFEHNEGIENMESDRFGSNSEDENDSRVKLRTEDKIPDSDSDGEVEAVKDMSKPEFEGMWNKHKPYSVPKDVTPPIIKQNASKMEQDIMRKVLDKHRDGIVVKQVAAGKEFKGRPFYSKPDVIHFKNFDVGKTYKKKIILTNVSYSVNYCKLLGITEHLKDFIEIVFDPPGQLSAGMNCEMLVTFKPMINEHLEGEVMFLAQTGPFSVPIICSIKQCDISVDTHKVDFGTTVIGEKLKRTITLTNKGALGTTYEFVKVEGLKPRTLTTAETSLGRLTTADTVRKDKDKEEPEGEKDTEKGKKDKKKGDKKDIKDDKNEKEKKSDEEIVELAADPVGNAEPAPPGDNKDMLDVVVEEGQEITSMVDFAGHSEMELDLSTIDGMKVGEVHSGEIGPFSSVKLEILWHPTIPGKVDTDFNITFEDPESAMITCKAVANAIDVPCWVERNAVDLKICLLDRLYQDTIIVNNRATTALRLQFDLPKDLREHMELLPKTGYIQAKSNFSAQLKFLPRQSIFTEPSKYFDPDTGVLEVPMEIKVADQTRPVPFTVHAIVTNSDLEFDKTNVDFGYCTIHESVKTTIKLTNKSILPQKFGFVGIPEYVDVQPDDGFGTLLPLETIELDIIFSPPKARNYSFELTCKSLINRCFKIKCEGIGVHPPLELSHQVIHFAATSLNDVSSSTFHVINSHVSTNEYTHPVPRLGRGDIAPVCPTSFQFVIPEGVPLTISPAVGTVEPGKTSRIQIRYTPTLEDKVIRKEAVRMAIRNMEAKAEKEYQDTLLKEKENDEQAAVVVRAGGPAAKKKPPPKKSPKGKPGKPGQAVPSEPTVRGPAKVTAPDAETIDKSSDEYNQAHTSLLRSFTGDFYTYTIPCYVASGRAGKPGELKYSIHNTLYLEVHCPVVKPQIVVISDNGRTTTDFGEVSIGKHVIKTFTVQNISEKEIEKIKISLLDPVGPFEVLNAFGSLEPDESHTVIVSFTPNGGRVFYEVLELQCPESTSRVTLTGCGVSPKVSLSLETPIMDMAAVLVNEYIEKSFKIRNTSSLSIEYRINLDSNSLMKHSQSQGLPQLIKVDPTSKSLVGVQNHNGSSVFDAVPTEGIISAGGSKEITLTFAPDHYSEHYSDGVRIELFGQDEAHVFQVVGTCMPHIMYVTGGDDIVPEIESLSILPEEEDEGAEKLPLKAILLTFNSISKESEFTTATRELFIGCVRTMAVSQKKNGEFSFENLNVINAKGFNLDPPKGQVEAGSKKPVTITWSPPAGQDPNLPCEASINLTVKGDAVDTYRILLRSLVVSE